MGIVKMEQVWVSQFQRKKKKYCRKQRHPLVCFQLWGRPTFEGDSQVCTYFWQHSVLKAIQIPPRTYVYVDSQYLVFLCSRGIYKELAVLWIFGWIFHFFVFIYALRIDTQKYQLFMPCLKYMPVLFFAYSYEKCAVVPLQGKNVEKLFSTGPVEFQHAVFQDQHQQILNQKKILIRALYYCY